MKMKSSQVKIAQNDMLWQHWLETGEDLEIQGYKMTNIITNLLDSTMS